MPSFLHLPSRRRRPNATLPAHIKPALAAIIDRIAERKYPHWAFLARALQVDENKACTLRNGNLSLFSERRLLIFLTRLGCDIEIRVFAPCYDWIITPHGTRAEVALPGIVEVHDFTGDPLSGMARRHAVDARRTTPQFQGSRSP